VKGNGRTTSIHMGLASGSVCLSRQTKGPTKGLWKMVRSKSGPKENEFELYEVWYKYLELIKETSQEFVNTYVVRPDIMYEDYYNSIDFEQEVPESKDFPHIWNKTQILLYKGH
jgi:hypothetical protein